MALSILDTGQKDIAALRRRILRDAAMDRILKSDADYLVELLNKMDAHIVRMTQNKHTLRNTGEY